jgi:hypothetical protein
VVRCRQAFLRCAFRAAALEKKGKRRRTGWWRVLVFVQKTERMRRKREKERGEVFHGRVILLCIAQCEAFQRLHNLLEGRMMAKVKK